MPQTFEVLKCYKCSIFQVHLTKKSTKWECKLCGEKQSLKRHYGIGTALECRGHVQKLNSMQGNKSDNVSQLDGRDGADVYDNIKKNRKQFYSMRKSKWLAFVDENDNSDSNHQADCKRDIPMQIAKKQRHETHKTEINENEIVSIFNSKSKDIKPQIQCSIIKTNKKSVLVSDDDIPISSPTKLQIPINQCKVHEVNDYKYTNKCNEKKNHRQDIEKSDKWSAFVSEGKSTNEICSKKSQKYSDIKETTSITIDLSQNDFLENQKEPIIEHSKLISTQSGRIPTTDDKATNLNIEKQILFSLCDENDLDSILDI